MWTQADIDALRAAIATGIKTVKYAGPPAREVTYHDLDEMRSLLAEMVRSVTGARSSRLAAYTKGFR